MENASKALMIAGGVILAMLIIAVLVFAWGQFSEYFERDKDLSEINDVTEFNLLFTNYDRDDVRGYDILSLANKVADYNFRFSNYTAVDENDRNARNNLNYSPIIMKVNMNGKASELWYESEDESTTQHIFQNTVYEQSSTRNTITNIITQMTGIEQFYGNPDTTAKLAKNIDSLILSQAQIEYTVRKGGTELGAQKSAVEKYNSIVSKAGEETIDLNDQRTTIVNGKTQLLTYKKMKDMLLSRANIKQYYEYYQFKRGYFKCLSDSITYNDTTGRISTITFEFTGLTK